MFKDLVNKPSDEEFKEIVISSHSVCEVARKLGFKFTPGWNSKKKIAFRILSLGVKIGANIQESTAIILSTKDKVNNKETMPKRFYMDDVCGESKMKGDISEMSVQLDLFKHGLKVSKPVGDNCPYDMVADYNGKLFKIQVKTGTLRKNGSIIAKLRTCHLSIGKKFTNRKYTKEEVDIFAVYSIEYDTICYFFNNGDMTSITFRSSDLIVDKRSNSIERFSLDNLLKEIK